MGIVGSSPPLTRLMAFIDGGYLRENFKRETGLDIINYNSLHDQLTQNFNANCRGLYRGDLIRVNYYDAIVDYADSKYKEQDEYFSKIRNIDSYEVRLGRLNPAGEQKSQLKQKGVDVHLAVEMITKAYLDHYDFALLLAGDDDFLDVVGAVKDTGKRVFGFYFLNHISKKLSEAFDAKIPMNNFVNMLKAN